jgi:D-sedoheptulose 7-phosphate isomerase
VGKGLDLTTEFEPYPAEPKAGRPEDRVAEIATRYMQDLGALLRDVDLHALARLVSLLRGIRTRRGTVYVAGNGGSAATAAHWVNDLCKAARRDAEPPLRAMSMADNGPWLTALANDEGFERVFSGQLENFAAEGDALVVISASGNSPNLIQAVELARARGLNTAALLGFDGGKLLTMVECAVLLRTPQGAYGLVESGHSILCDIVATCLAQGAG